MNLPPGQISDTARARQRRNHGSSALLSRSAPRRMVHAGLSSAVFLAFAGGLLAQPAVDFYVAANGRDSNPGTIDAPFDTLERARDAVREKIAGGLSADVHVFIRGGTYRLAGPVIFDLADSGTDQFAVRYSAFPGERPVFSGGRRIEGWKANADGTWSASIAEAREGKWTFRELFVNGERRTRARHPNEGYLRVARAGPDRRTTFNFTPGDIKASPDLESVELVFLHDWSISRIRMKSVDEHAHTVTLADPVGSAAPHYAMDHFEPNPRYYLENSSAFLDSPGEWHLDIAAGRLTYKPMPGERLDQIDAVAPVATGLISVRGDIDGDRPVRNLHFHGLGFEHCAWSLPPRGYAAGQATFYDQRGDGDRGGRRAIPAALDFEFAQHCSVARASIAHLGGSGIWFGARCQDNLLADSVLTDISGNGVMVGEDTRRTVADERWWQRAPGQVATRNAVRNNLIERCGRQFFGAVGLWAGITRETIVAQNEIRHLPYTGVSLGWMWSTTPTPCRENLVEKNHIHHVMQVLSDGGGIYTLGWQPGSMLRENIIHDVPLNAGRAESNGMFIDEGSTDFLIESNVIYNVDRSPLRFHRATTNRVENNVLVTAPDIPPFAYNATQAEDIRKTANVILSSTNAELALAKTVAQVVAQAGPSLSASQGGSPSEGRTAPMAAAPENAALEKQFKELLTDAVFVGRWCLVKDGAMGEEQDEKYTIHGASKVGGEVWLIHARVQYGRRDLVVPIPVKVKWAGDTPIISITDLGIPGLGTYTARVVVYGGTYAGTWSGGNHAGLLHGIIRKLEAVPEENPGR